MAEIVFGVGCSHGPSIQMPPESWATLAEKDKRDPRFDYQALLAAARPDMAAEITLDLHRQRFAASHAAMEEVTRRIAAARPDVVVVVSNAHAVQHHEPRPVFALLRAPTFPAIAATGVTFETAAAAQAGAPPATMPGHPALADHLIGHLIEAGIDMGCIDRLRDGATIDEAFVFCYKWLLAGTAIPMVPLYLSRDLPNQPTPRRSIELGWALRAAIDACPLPLRIGLIASGGLSHQVVDEELDRGVLERLAAADLDGLHDLSRERLNRSPGTPEILNWLVLGGSMAPAPLEVVSYAPCYRSPAGTGQGAAIGYWTP